MLGAGMDILILKYITKIPDYILFWVNMVFAILDNAILTAVEISPAMSQRQIDVALYGLLTLRQHAHHWQHPPNIISSEWTKLGVPFGLVLNAIHFVLGINPRLGL